MSDFHEQLTVANKYEHWLGAKFDKNVTYNNNNEYDIKLSCGKTIEVKHDYQTDTGNIAIEWFCRNKPSGISTSNSDYYIYIFPLLQEVWKIKTKELKIMIKDFKNSLHNDEDNWTSELYFRENVAGGDDDGTGEGRSKLYLFRRSEVKHKFQVIKMNIPKY